MRTWAASQQLVIGFFLCCNQVFPWRALLRDWFRWSSTEVGLIPSRATTFVWFWPSEVVFYKGNGVLRTLTNSQFFGTVDALIPSYRDDRTRPWVLLVSNWAPSSKTFELVTMPALTAPPTPPRSLRGRVLSANINPLGDSRSGHHNNRSTSADEEEQR